MPEIFEVGIVGMGPAGIGLSTSLQDEILKKTICFDRGQFANQINCTAITDRVCCNANACHVISGIGGASNLSSGKISFFPAGSGLVRFFDSEDELKQLMKKVIHIMEETVSLKKINITEDIIINAKSLYRHHNIDYKYYDVYEFDGEKYRQVLINLVRKLTQNGLQLHKNANIIQVKYDSKKSYYTITAIENGIENEYFVHNLVFATGALEVQEKLISQVLNLKDLSFEIGVRVETESKFFGKSLQSHGDLKLKAGQCRTYCVSENGAVISYLTNKLHFLEGYVNPLDKTGLTNLAVLFKMKDDAYLSRFFDNYKSMFHGIPIKQKYDDYIENRFCGDEIISTLAVAQNGNINLLYSQDINFAIKRFIKTALIDAVGLTGSKLTIIAPELKLLNQYQLQNNFQAAQNLYIIGAATGQFRGILQALCSGIRCSELIGR